MAKRKEEKLVLVEALQLGYYGEERRYPGEKFAMKDKDFFAYDNKGKRVREESYDDETGEDVEVYKTTSWVNLIEEDYDPYKQAEAEQAPQKKKVRIGPQDSKFPAPEPLSMQEPQSPNPGGFAPAGKPVKAVDAHKVDADKDAPQATKVKVAKPATEPNQGSKESSDDVI